MKTDEIVVLVGEGQRSRLEEIGFREIPQPVNGVIMMAHDSVTFTHALALAGLARAGMVMLGSCRGCDGYAPGSFASLGGEIAVVGLDQNVGLSRYRAIATQVLEELGISRHELIASLWNIS